MRWYMVVVSLSDSIILKMLSLSPILFSYYVCAAWSTSYWHSFFNYVYGMTLCQIYQNHGIKQYTNDQHMYALCSI